MTKLVIENYLRSIPFGSKYWYQTIPKVITLWLDLGVECMSKAKGDAQYVSTPDYSYTRGRLTRTLGPRFWSVVLAFWIQCIDR